MLPKQSGIYQVTFLGRIYVGSAMNIKRRCDAHLGNLRRGTHHSPSLQAAFDKHRGEPLVFSVLEIVKAKDDLLRREQFWLDTLKPFGKRGFNHATVAGNRLGLRAGAEGRARCSVAQRARFANPFAVTAETRAKLRASRLGYKCSDEMKANLSRSRLGVKLPPQTPEHKAKCGAARTGHKTSQETREKIRASNLGQKRSPEVRQRISIAQRARFARERELRRAA